MGANYRLGVEEQEGWMLLRRQEKKSNLPVSASGRYRLTALLWKTMVRSWIFTDISTWFCSDCSPLGLWGNSHHCPLVATDSHSSAALKYVASYAHRFFALLLPFLIIQSYLPFLSILLEPLPPQKTKEKLNISPSVIWYIHQKL